MNDFDRLAVAAVVVVVFVARNTFRLAQPVPPALDVFDRLVVAAVVVAVCVPLIASSLGFVFVCVRIPFDTVSRTRCQEGQAYSLGLVFGWCMAGNWFGRLTG